MDEHYHFTDEKIYSLKVLELKSYLKRHNQPVMGNKAALIVRAKGVKKLNLRRINDIESEDNLCVDRRWTEKLTTPLGEQIPDPSTLLDWISDLSAIPNFTDNDIYNYLVLTMKSKRQMRSKVYYEDRHVHSLEYSAVSDTCSHCIIRCKVLPSIPTSNKLKNPDHDVWVCLSKVTGKVNSANCNCVAGEGEACNHVGALLYALVDVTNNTASGIAATSLPCKWNNPRKRKVSPKRAQELNFSQLKPKLCDTTNNTTDSNTDTHNSTCSDKPATKNTHTVKSTLNQDRFRTKLLKANLNVGWLTFFHTDTPHIPKLHDITFLYHDKINLKTEICQEYFEEVFNNMTVSESEVIKIEKLTRGQNKNEQWQKARSERITSSNFGSILKRKSHLEPDNLVKTILNYREFDNKHVKWGRDHEPAARRSYINCMVKHHENLSVLQCGLLVNVQHPHLGSSPDGLLSCVCCGDGVLEIKCPSSDKWKLKSPNECCADGDFFCTLDENNEVVLKSSHNYYYQIQGQMGITGRMYCDFVIWTLKGLSVQRIAFNTQLWDTMLKKLKDFYYIGIIPELYSRRIKRGRSLYSVC